MANVALHLLRIFVIIAKYIFFYEEVNENVFLFLTDI